MNKNKILATRVVSSIPKHLKAVVFIMETLQLSKESVYRRIRGEVAFTFDEVITLASALGISVDEIVGKNMTNSAVFSITDQTTSTPQVAFETMLSSYIDTMTQNSQAASRDGVVSVNRLMPLFHTHNKALFRFFYYRWMHQMQNTPINFRYSDAKVPDSVLALCDKVSEMRARQTNSTIIAHENLYINTFQEIEYFYKRNLISSEDMEEIKDDLREVIDQMEALAARGITRNGANVSLFLSEFEIDFISILVNRDNTLYSYFWIGFANMMSTRNPALCANHKLWLDSIKKYATSITCSNQMLQAKFFNKQRKNLDLLGTM
jgi:hypothetical protein